MRDGGERAVVAAVAAQPGQRDEDLARVGDDAGPAGVDQPGVADAAGGGEQLVEVRRRGRRAGRRPRSTSRATPSRARRSARRIAESEGRGSSVSPTTSGGSAAMNATLGRESEIGSPLRVPGRVTAATAAVPPRDGPGTLTQSMSCNIFIATQRLLPKGDRDADAPDRRPRGVGSRVAGAAGAGEGAHPRPRRDGRAAAPDAVARGRPDVRVRRPAGPGHPARPVRGPQAAGRLPRLLRAGRARLARPRLRRLLLRHGRPARRTSPTCTPATRRSCSPPARRSRTSHA